MSSLEYYYANRERALQRVHKYYQDNKVKCKATQKAYYLKHRVRYQEYHKQLDIEYPLKRQCRNIVRTAIENGKLKRGCCCEDCKVTSDQEKIYGHHEDYNKPLEVIWLCQSCHMRRHTLILGLNSVKILL